MARIHTLSDLAREDKFQEQQTDSYGARSGRSLLPFTSGEGPPSGSSVLECLFPKFSWKHCVFAFTVVDFVMYIATVAYDRSPDNPTSPSMSSLAFFGASIPQDIRRGQVWRLICPMFLHTSIFHLLINIFMQVRIGASIEEKWGLFTVIADAYTLPRLWPSAKYGTRRVCVAYLVCGILGNLVSASVFFCNMLKVGASTAIFGLIGIDLAELLVIWESINDRRPVLLQLAVFALFFIFFSLGNSTDVMGHLGGMAVGMSFGLAYNRTNPLGSANVGLYNRISYAVLAFVVGLSGAALWMLPRTCT